jgi:hypothetical protein
MDTKLTLHFNRDVIENAKAFAAANNVSLSRLTEYLYQQITSGSYKTLDDFPVADWVNQVAEGKAVYMKRSRKKLNNEFFSKSR